MSARRRPGMTLMELMVALAITGMMTAAGYGAFASLIDHRRALGEATARLERAAALREQLDGWLASGEVQLQQGGGPTRAARTAGTPVAPNTSAAAGATANTAAAAVGPDADLTLTTTAPTPSLAPSTRLRLYVDGGANTPERGLCVEYQAGPQAPLARRELDSTVTAMTVEFLDGTTHRWVRPSEGATSSRPLAVRVTLSSADPARVDSLPAILRLPIVRPTVDQPGREHLGTGDVR
ncbi:hypothetical protein tb265_02230 [Gemmatimonadetes bacterium T265]|nr:hypothetical protein tb265_02230 [Gemmatimonadetes bacterium T265]